MNNGRFARRPIPMAGAAGSRRLCGERMCVAFSAGGITAGMGQGHGARCHCVCLRQPGPRNLALEAKEAGARIVATGRSDFPNQVNNSLVFPASFRRGRCGHGLLPMRWRSPPPMNWRAAPGSGESRRVFCRR